MRNNELNNTDDEIQCTTVQGLATRLSIGLTSAYALCKQKDFFPAKRIRGRVVVCLRSLRVWLEKQTFHGGDNESKKSDEV